MFAPQTWKSRLECFAIRFHHRPLVFLPRIVTCPPSLNDSATGSNVLRYIPIQANTIKSRLPCPSRVRGHRVQQIQVFQVCSDRTLSNGPHWFFCVFIDHALLAPDTRYCHSHVHCLESYFNGPSLTLQTFLRVHCQATHHNDLNHKTARLYQNLNLRNFAA